MIVPASTTRSTSFLPLLITGLAGVPGFNAFTYFRHRYGGRVIGVRRPDLWPLNGAGIVACDLEDSAAIESLWQQHEFRAVLNCIGCCKLKSCEYDPGLARRVNVATTTNVATQAAKCGARLVHLSIDLVFSGSGSGAYCETDPTDPVTVYGETMVEAERVVRERLPEATILRISLPMGVSFNGHAGAIDWIASRFKQDKPATLFYDEIRTPTYVDCMHSLYEQLLGSQLPGLYHAGGPRPLSLYQIAQIVNVVGGFDPQLLRGCHRHEASPIPPRAGNVTLNSSALATAIGDQPFDPWPLSEQLVPTDRDWHRRGQLPSAQRGSSILIADLLYRNPRQPRDDIR